MSDAIHIDGLKICLPTGRHVWVGRHDGFVLVEFMNSEGLKTRLKLSEDAASALRWLLIDENKRQDDPGGLVQQMICHMMAATAESQEHTEWRITRTNTAPTFPQGIGS